MALSGADERAPRLVGAAAWSRRSEDPAAAANPLAILVDAACGAAADAGGGAALLAAVDTVAVVNVSAWPAKNPARLLGEVLALRPAREIVTTLGGNSPLMLVNRLAREIAAGACDVALVAGCDVFGTAMRARRRGVALDWPAGGDGDPLVLGDARTALHPTEQRHGLLAPSITYPLFENALRARRGWSLAEHRRRLGELLAPMTEVAAANPFAWFPIRRSAEEIATPGPANRLVGFPYTKYMNAILEVDQGAAVILCSAARARALGLAEPRAVYWWGGGDATEEPFWTCERPRLSRSAGLARAGRGALLEAGVAIGEVGLLDLYSCFPCAVQIAREELGIPDDDPRPLTLTGGLPYAGGPGNAYTLMSLARAVERLRAEPGARALLTGVGWYLSKHAATVLGAAPRPASAPSIGATPPAPASAPPPLPVAAEAEGSGEVETYTVVHARDGAPQRGLVIGRLDDGRRFVADLPSDPALLESLETADPIGRRGRVRPAAAGRNVFTPE